MDPGRNLALGPEVSWQSWRLLHSSVQDGVPNEPPSNQRLRIQSLRVGLALMG
jgi:hypothetical protein